MRKRAHGFQKFFLLTVMAILAGCVALPQASFMLGRMALHSMGVENVRIGPWAVPTDALTLEPTALLRAGLDLSGMPVSLDLPLSLTPPDAAPEINLAGYAWQLIVPGAEPVGGEVNEPVTLSPGEPTMLSLPVELRPEITSGENADHVRQLLALAGQLAGSQQLPAGTMLSLTPQLAGDMARLIPAPTITLDISTPEDQQSRPGLPSISDDSPSSPDTL